MQNHRLSLQVTLIIALITVCPLLAPICFADDSVTITTYYPAPYGVYKEMRLYPNDSENDCDANNKGSMYFDDSEGKTKVCDGSSWQLMGQSGGTVIYLKCAWTGMPTNCTPPSCPSGWSDFGWQNYVTTGSVGALGDFGYTERICRNSQFLETYSLKCAVKGWAGASCVPSSPCQSGWAQLGIGCAYLGNVEGWQMPTGYCEKICGK